MTDPSHCPSPLSHASDQGKQAVGQQTVSHRTKSPGRASVPLSLYRTGRVGQTPLLPRVLSIGDCFQAVVETFLGAEIVTDDEFSEIETRAQLARQSDWVRRWNDWAMVLEADREARRYRGEETEWSLPPLPAEALF